MSVSFETVLGRIAMAPSSGPYCEEARRDAFEQLAEIRERQKEEPETEIDSLLEELARFWEDDYKFAVIDDNFVHKHAFVDAYSQLLVFMQKVQLDRESDRLTAMEEKVLRLGNEAKEDFLNTISPNFFDPQERWRKAAESFLAEFQREIEE